MADDRDDALAIARFGRAHGTKGEVRLWAYNPDSPLYEADLLGWIEGEDGPRNLTITHVRWGDRFGIAALKDLRYRDEAEALTNHEFFISRAQLPEPDPDEFYLNDTIGWPVGLMIEDEVRHIGEVDGYLATGANDVMRVGVRGGDQLLVPLIDAALRQFDPDLERVVLWPLEQWAMEGTQIDDIGEVMEVDAGFFEVRFEDLVPPLDPVYDDEEE